MSIKCPIEGCEKDFQSDFALRGHLQMKEDSTHREYYEKHYAEPVEPNHKPIEKTRDFLTSFIQDKEASRQYNKDILDGIKEELAEDRRLVKEQHDTIWWEGYNYFENRLLPEKIEEVSETARSEGYGQGEINGYNNGYQIGEQDNLIFCANPSCRGHIPTWFLRQNKIYCQNCLTQIQNRQFFDNLKISKNIIQAQDQQKAEKEMQVNTQDKQRDMIEMLEIKLEGANNTIEQDKEIFAEQHLLIEQLTKKLKETEEELKKEIQRQKKDDLEKQKSPQLNNIKLIPIDNDNKGNGIRLQSVGET